MPVEPRPYAVVDIDGVLADVRHRLRHVEQRPKDWGAFFAAADRDPVLAEGRAVAQRLAEDHDLVYLSGRPEWLRDVTLGWLHRFDIPGGDLLLRSDRDRRPARVLKVEILRRLARERPVDVFVDDDSAVCAAARAAGFTVLEATWARPDQALFDAQESDGRT